jgi:hypothetical protein
MSCLRYEMESVFSQCSSANLIINIISNIGVHNSFQMLVHTHIQCPNRLYGTSQKPQYGFIRASILVIMIKIGLIYCFLVFMALRTQATGHNQVTV